MKFLAVFFDAGNLDFGFFQLVDGFVNFAQILVVFGPKIFSTRHFGDFAKQVFINFYLGVIQKETAIAEPADRGERFADGPYADGIHFDAQFLGQFASSEGFEIPHIVDPIGKQDDDFTFGFAAFESVHCSSQTHPDGGAIFEIATFQLLQKTFNNFVVGSEGALGKRFASKNDQTNAIVGAAFDKLHCHFFTDGQAVWLKILGQHATR